MADAKAAEGEIDWSGGLNIYALRNRIRTDIIEGELAAFTSNGKSSEMPGSTSWIAAENI